MQKIPGMCIIEAEIHFFKKLKKKGLLTNRLILSHLQSQESQGQIFCVLFFLEKLFFFVHVLKSRKKYKLNFF